MLHLHMLIRQISCSKILILGQNPSFWQHCILLNLPPTLTYLQGVPEELVICGYHLLNLRSDLLHTSESGSAGLTNPRPLPTHGFLDIGETGIVWNESQELFRWRFDICPHEAEDIICILSPSFTTQFGDRVYIRLYINSDCTRYRANATSIFLVTVAKAKNSLSSLVTNVFRSHNYFNLSPLDSKNAFSLGRKDNIVQAVHGLQEFVPTTELAQSTTGGTICLGVQFIV